MEIEVEPGHEDQRPQTATQIRVTNNNKDEKGSYQILPDGMELDINASTNVTENLVTNSTAFKNTGPVLLTIQWI